MTGKTLWYLTRGTGVVALVLLTLSLVLGILEVRRWERPGWPRFLTAGLHRNVSLLSTAFIAAHIATSVLDRFAPIHWVDSVMPFLSGYRPLWLGLGTVAVDLTIAVIVTSLLRSHLGYRTWRAVHWAAYASWPVALVHSIGTGSDVHQPWMLAILVACLAAVLGSILWRLGAGAPETASGRGLAALGTLVALGALVAWTAAGPLQAGWAARAGTPQSLLAANAAGTSSAATSSAGTSSGGTAGSAAAPAGTSLQPPFSATFAGTISQSGAAAGLVTVLIDGVLTGGATGHLSVSISGPPASGGGVAMTASSVRLGTSGQQALYQGSIGSLSGTSFVAGVSGASGAPMTLTVSLRIDQQAGTARGTVIAAAGAGSSGGDNN
jgi:sulfoxide reductase heme-binding subunit YedZ